MDIGQVVVLGLNLNSELKNLRCWTSWTNLIPEKYYAIVTTPNWPVMPHPLFSNIGHHVKILAMIANLFNGWCHLHQLQIWPPSGTKCIGSTFSHQVAPLALFPKLVIATLAWIAYWHYQLVLSWYLHQPESHQLSLNKVSHSLTDIRTQRSDPRFTWVR